MRLRPLTCWDCGFEPRRMRRCLSLVNILCCPVEVSATGRSLVQRSPTNCVYVSLCAVSCNSNPLHLQGVCTRGQTKKENVIEMIIEGLCLSVDYPFMVPVLGRISDGNYYQLQDKFRTFLRLLVAPCILLTFNLF